MYGHLDRDTLISRILAELGEDAPTQLGTFAGAILRRVDDSYLYKHRMTTLGAQLRESYTWVASAMCARDVRVRVFSPTADAHGYEIEGQIIETVMPDQPFIFDTLKLAMDQLGIRVVNVLHIILPASIEGDSGVVSVGSDEGSDHFSYTRWYVDWASEFTANDVGEEITERLTLARQMVRDFHRMLRDLKAAANEFEYLATLKEATRDDCIEVRDFLAWLIDDNFVFMGKSAYVASSDDDGTFIVDEARGLGTARGVSEPSAHETQATLQALAANPRLSWPIARVRKSSADSVIHRSGKVDEILVRTFDQEGKATGGIVIHGMFTFKGLGEPGSQIPILRRKLDAILKHSDTVRSSYEHKGRVHAFNALPVEYLFEAEVSVIEELLRMTRQADDAKEIRTHIVTQPDADSAYVFVVLPKESYSDDLRQLLQTVLQVELRASYADHRVHLGKYGSVALHFYLTGSENFGAADLASIESKVIEIGTPWRARLRRSLQREYGDGKGTELYARYADAFPESYADATGVDDAVVDIHHLQKVLDNGRTRFDIFPSHVRDGDALLRIYSQHDLLLTDTLPVVDNFGVVVVEQFAHEVTPGDDGLLVVNTLRIRRGPSDILAQRKALIDGLRAVFGGRMRSGRFNRLLLPAQITWREVDMLRAYFNYSRQLGNQATHELVEKVMLGHAHFVQGLCELFRARFDTDANLNDGMRDKQVERLERRLLGYLDEVKGFEEDRILRTFLDLVMATLRTNFYQKIDQHRLSFKIACAAVADMPSPRPMFEIYVHHSEVEGVHLRGGKVARGGIRWSDRPDDYRSEVLGLMATQMLKNTLIVPVGAKGGFILKDVPEDWPEARAAADRLYEVFIQGLLDITDNLVDGEIVPPPNVVRYDEDDPYLVVAADKGTAHLSDTANRLSLAANFWLGDAFASGGSVGYDHKEKGITARGSWVCVRRHFMEMGIDPESDVISAVGIGDMSGDVFGNGLLCSKTIKLIGAFNHRHIFLDPNPDPAVSFAERQRLFDMGRSAWTHYDPELISTGGGVFDRGAKSISLSDPARAVLGTDATELSGEALIQLILRADVDLLWNGGIGTYIKASTESHADVGDASNDRVRVDASKLRCAVISEGGNLGVTMRGRVEFCERGGRINLDAIDNSGGVDLSDHEVNIKTLLRHPVAMGTLSSADRDALLIGVGDEVCDAVLRNNDDQSLAISLDETRGRDDTWQIVHSMMFLREHLGFSRRQERLPRGTQVIRQRIDSDTGFFRPELAKLLAYSKRFVHEGLEHTPIGDKDALRPFLNAYFPARILAEHGDAVPHHFLYDAIAATVQVNRVVDMAGVTFFPTLSLATERPANEILAGYLLAEALTDVAPLRSKILGQSKLSSEARYQALIRVEDHLLLATRALLWNHTGTVTLATADALAAVRETAALLDTRLSGFLPERARRALKDDVVQLRHLGLSAGVSKRLAGLAWLDHAFAITRLAGETGQTADDAAQTYFETGFDLRVLDFVAAIARQSMPDRWDNIAVHALARELLDSVLRVARLRVGSQGLRQRVTDALEDIPRQIEALLRERIPVSAMLVLSQRIVQRLGRLEAEVAAPRSAPALAEPSSAA